MGCLWSHKENTVRQVYDCLKKRRAIAYTTVMTILGRLNKKKIVSREKVGRAYVYEPRFTKRQILQRVAHQTIRSLSVRYGSDALAAFAQEFQELPIKERERIVRILLEEDK